MVITDIFIRDYRSRKKKMKKKTDEEESKRIFSTRAKEEIEHCICT